MQPDFVKRMIQRMIASALASPDRVTGCSETEIQQVESSFSCRLPEAYRSFLSLMGRGAGDLLIGTDIFFPKVLQLRAWAESLLARTESKFLLPSTAFVFLVHQGYQFMFFDVLKGDDPEVFHFEEGEDQARKVFGHFTEWLTACVEDEIAAHQEVHRK